MERLKLVFLGFMFSTSCPTVKPTGLCEFAIKSPCEYSPGEIPLNTPGCRNTATSTGYSPLTSVEANSSDKYSRNTPMSKADDSSSPVTAPSVYSTFHQRTILPAVTADKMVTELNREETSSVNIETSLETNNHSISNDIFTGQFTSYRVSLDSVSTDGGTLVDFANDREPTSYSELIQVSSSTQVCPPNMIYANCSTCQRTCSEPNICISDCNENETCVCPAGYFLKEVDCVPQAECGCYIQGYGELEEGKFHVNSDCTSRCLCSLGKLVCLDSYRCGSNATCEDRYNIKQCYCNTGFIGDGDTCISSDYAVDCYDGFLRGYVASGLLHIKPTTCNAPQFLVYCDMAHGGGWTVFQRRLVGDVDFDRDWDDFKGGFGVLAGDHWLGNEKIFCLTSQRDYQLRIDFLNAALIQYLAEYEFLRIDSEANNYKISVGNYTGGDAGDSLKAQKNEKFSTRDQDNDDLPFGHIASAPNRGAWWYGRADYSSDLNANLISGDIYWKTLPGNAKNIRFTEMKIRPV